MRSATAKSRLALLASRTTPGKGETPCGLGSDFVEQLGLGQQGETGIDADGSSSSHINGQTLTLGEVDGKIFGPLSEKNAVEVQGHTADKTTGISFHVKLVYGQARQQSLLDLTLAPQGKAGQSPLDQSLHQTIKVPRG